MDNTFEIDLQEVWKELIKRIWIIALCAALVGAAVFAYTATWVAPMYQAGVTMYVNNNSGKDSQYVSANDLSVAMHLAGTYVSVIKSDRVLGKVVEDLGLTLTTDQVRSMVSAEAEEDTEIFRVSVISPNPQMSADIANAIARLAPAVIADIIEGSSAKTIDEAKIPQNKYSPSLTLNTIVGGFTGAFLAVLAIALRLVLDTRVKSEEDLQKICDIPVLGAIPNLAGDGKKVRR